MKKLASICANELDTYLDYTVFTLICLYHLNASTFEMGILGACFAAPFLFFSKILGKLSDTLNIYSLRSILFFINLVVMPFTLVADSVAIIYIIVLCKIACRCGINVSTPKLNEKAQESKTFYEIYGYMINVSRIVIPLLIINLNSYLGLWFIIGVSVLFNFIGFISSILGISGEGRFHTKNHQKNKNNNNYSFNEQIIKKPKLFILILAFTLSNLSFYLSNDMLSVFFEKIGQDENSIGYIISILGVGGILGTKYSSYLLNKQIPSSVFIMSVLINCIAFSGFGFLSSEYTNHIVYYLFILMTGVASGITFVSVRFGIRNLIEFEYLSQTTGMIQKISSIVAITMPLIGGYIAGLTSIEFTFKVTSIILLIVLVVTFVVINRQSYIAKEN